MFFLSSELRNVGEGGLRSQGLLRPAARTLTAPWARQSTLPVASAQPAADCGYTSFPEARSRPSGWTSLERRPCCSSGDLEAVARLRSLRAGLSFPGCRPGNPVGFLGPIPHMECTRRALESVSLPCASGTLSNMRQTGLSAPLRCPLRGRPE